MRVPHEEALPKAQPQTAPAGGENAATTADTREHRLPGNRTLTLPIGPERETRPCFRPGRDAHDALVCRAGRRAPP